MVESWGLTDPGCVRANNEDYFLIAHNLGLYLVADGMGGAQAGECASRLAADTVADYLAANDPTAENALTAAFEEANRSVRAAAAATPEFKGMGTTLVAALIRAGDVAIASAGDSRAYLFENGALRAISEDQTWVNEIGRRLGLDEATLNAHPLRHLVTVAVGASASLRVRSYVIRPEPGSILLLCSDGLHGAVDDQTIGTILAAGGSLEQRARELIGAARRADGPDNVTTVLLRFG
jgi:protein phosphatase